MIAEAIAGRQLPVYGDGLQVRDWLFVRDHTAALRRVLAGGRPGETYNIGGGNQTTNLQVVHSICALLDELLPGSPHRPHASLTRFVADRPGHDRRYAINSAKIEDELDWRPAYTFEAGLRQTVEWYLSNQAWMESIRTGAYREWMQRNYAAREVHAKPVAAADASALEGKR